MKKTKVEGRVTSIDDPAKAGRVKVEIQGADGDEYPEWVRPSFTPGWIAMPEVGDTVDVELPDGDDIVEFADQVTYTGKVLDGENPVPEDFKEGDKYGKRRGFRSPAGHFLIFDDEDGIVLTVGNGIGGNIGLSIDASSGSVQLYGTTQVVIKATAHVSIEGLSCSILGRPVSPLGGPI